MAFCQISNPRKIIWLSYSLHFSEDGYGVVNLLSTSEFPVFMTQLVDYTIQIKKRQDRFPGNSAFNMLYSDWRNLYEVTNQRPAVKAYSSLKCLCSNIWPKDFMSACWRMFRKMNYSFSGTSLPCFIREIFRFVWYANIIFVTSHWIMSFCKKTIFGCLPSLYWDKYICLPIKVTCFTM